MLRSNEKKIAVIVQCRLSSTRLPGKALKKLGEKTVLEWTLASMKKVRAGRYFVATDYDSYEELKPYCQKAGFEIYAGSLDDVLDRYCSLINEIKCDYVLRATADNPFLFYEAAQELINEFVKQQKIARCDYMTWSGLPHGSGVEVFRADSLLKAREMTEDPYDHEHVGPALYNHKGVFSSLFVRSSAKYYYPDFRTTIDTPSDFRKAMVVVNRISQDSDCHEPYTYEQIVSALKDPAIGKTMLFMPSVKKGQGTGHLRRCLECALETSSFVYVPKSADLTETWDLINTYKDLGLKDFQIVDTFPQNGEYDLIVTDLFNTDLDTISKLRQASQLICLDEGSLYTDYCDYVFDIIPSLNLNREANLNDPSFIQKPKNRKKDFGFESVYFDKSNDSIKKKVLDTSRLNKILICFGGEDPANMTVKTAEFFSAAGKEVTAIINSDCIPSKKDFQNIKYMGAVPGLREKLFEYDLVVTHYGLTAYEAASAGCAVLLFSPTKLHQQLAIKYGFCAADVSLLAISSPAMASIACNELLGKSLNLYPSLMENKGFAHNDISLGSYLKTFTNGKRYMCPACQKEDYGVPDKIVARNSKRTFRKCRHCGMVYISWAKDGEQKKYEASYFAQSYKDQYGKTYLEDFESIKKTGSLRISHINSILKKNRTKGKSILDIGCAYGPFLSAAKDAGWNVYGTDISEDAIRYVQKDLFFPASVAAFPDFDSAKEFGVNLFDAITMWYVIEHFQNLDQVLKKVSSMVKKGGVFAFSTPSGSGVSAKFNARSFYEQSPSDHYSIFQLETVSKIMERYGFKVVKIISTGHHPERFAQVKKAQAEPGTALFKRIDVYSRRHRLGDTFEVYCRRK